jgi:hypothetical protein
MIIVAVVDDAVKLGHGLEQRRVSERERQFPQIKVRGRLQADEGLERGVLLVTPHELFVAKPCQTISKVVRDPRGLSLMIMVIDVVSTTPAAPSCSREQPTRITLHHIHRLLPRKPRLIHLRRAPRKRRKPLDPLGSRGRV